MIDLFQTPEKMPAQLAAIVDKWGDKCTDGLSYKECAQFQKQVEAIGYTFDWYLDAEPYNLRPIQKRKKQKQ